jgi:hypothetical protein
MLYTTIVLFFVYIYIYIIVYTFYLAVYVYKFIYIYIYTIYNHNFVIKNIFINCFHEILLYIKISSTTFEYILNLVKKSLFYCRNKKKNLILKYWG